MRINPGCCNDCSSQSSSVVLQIVSVRSSSNWAVFLHLRESGQPDSSISHAPRATAAILDQFRYAFVYRIPLALSKPKFVENRVIYKSALKGRV